MGVPALKPIRIPPSICEEDREYLAKRRTRQNYSYQASIYLLECIRKHQDIPPKYWVGGMDATKSYLQQLEKQANAELKEEQLLMTKTAEAQAAVKEYTEEEAIKVAQELLQITKEKTNGN